MSDDDDDRKARDAGDDRWLVDRPSAPSAGDSRSESSQAPGTGWATADIPIGGAAPPSAPLRPAPMHPPAYIPPPEPAPAPVPMPHAGPPVDSKGESGGGGSKGDSRGESPGDSKGEGSNGPEQPADRQSGPGRIPETPASPPARGGSPRADAAVQSPPAAERQTERTRKRWPVLTAAALALVLLGAAVPIGIQMANSASGSPTPTTTAGPVPTTTPTSSPPTTPSGPPTTTAPTTPSSTVTTTSTSTIAPNPMGGDFQALSCGVPGYIVQVASELSEDAYRGRVAELRANNQLPAGTHYLTDEGDCGLFTVQSSLWVLYTGPFTSVPDACPTRLTSPPDAFIKGTTDGTRKEYFSCMCVTDVARMPTLPGAAQDAVWVGELQRALRTKLDYDVGQIDADAGVAARWGEYTSGTAGAVARFNADNGLGGGTTVDGQTWSALKSAACA